MGRPPKGRDDEGKPVAVSRTYPQLTIRVRPQIKSDLALLAFGLQLTQAEVIEKSLQAFTATLPVATRKMLEGLRAMRQEGGR